MPTQTLTKGCKQTETGNPIRPLWALGRLTPPGPTCKCRGCWHPHMSPGRAPRRRYCTLLPACGGSPWEGLCGHAPPSQPSFRRARWGPRAPGLLSGAATQEGVWWPGRPTNGTRGWEQLRALDWLWKQTGAFTKGEVPSYHLAGLRLHPALPCNMITSKRCPNPQPHRGGAR